MITLRNVNSPSETESVSGLDALSLTIPGGEIVSVTGASSAVRRRLLGILGLYSDDWSGEYELFGHAVHKLDEPTRAELRGELIGVMMSCAPLVDCLSVEENLEIPLSYRGIPASDRVEMIEEALSRLGVASIRDREVDSLPGDQLQLVGIAKALVSNARMVLLEEPLMNLHELQIRRVSREIERRSSEGCIVVQCHAEMGAGLGADRVIELANPPSARRGRSQSKSSRARLDGVAIIR